MVVHQLYMSTALNAWFPDGGVHDVDLGGLAGRPVQILWSY